MMGVPGAFGFKGERGPSGPKGNTGPPGAVINFFHTVTKCCSHLSPHLQLFFFTVHVFIVPQVSVDSKVTKVL